LKSRSNTIGSRRMRDTLRTLGTVTMRAAVEWPFLGCSAVRSDAAGVWSVMCIRKRVKREE
jgi:hypothetical protein